MMKTKDLPAVTSALIEKMKADGYGQSRIEDTIWILEHFEHYCTKQGIGLVTVPVAVEFVRDSFGFDYYNTTSRFQTILRRPLLILFEFEEFGSYKKDTPAGFYNTDSTHFWKQYTGSIWIMSTVCRSA